MEPEFARGCVVLIDPAGQVRDGVFVLAELPDAFVLRRLRLDGNEVWLDALHPAYPPERCDAGLGSVVGVVSQRAGRRRREHKRYD